MRLGAGERVRVLRVVTRLNVGGPALHTVLLTERLDPSAYECWLVAGAEGEREGSYLELRGKSVERLISLPCLGREIRAARDAVALAELVRRMRRLRPHIVHTHTAKAGSLGRLAALIARVPLLVHTYHGHVFDGYFSPRQASLFVRIERWLGRRTQRLLAVSESVRRDLLALGIGDPGKLRVVPVGLDLEPFVACERLRGGLRRDLGVPAGAPLVGIVARLAPIKAHEVFLEAAQELARTVPATRFAVVGDGERRGELEALTRRLGLERAVRFLGWRRDLDRVYADLDLMALTSRNEGSPLALIEAMAAGLPVVATRVGGVPDVVEDGVSGLLVPPNSPSALAAAMAALLAAPDRRRALGTAGRRHVLPRFSAARLVADLDRVYMELASERGLHGPRPADEPSVARG